jgi:phosphatidylinositol alpha-mannosyltransferase
MISPESDKKRRELPLKIGIFTEYFYPTLGGVSEHVYFTYKELKRHGHTVKIITGARKKAEDFSPPGLEKDVINIGKSFPIPSNGGIAWITLGFGLRRKLKKVLEEEKFDLLHLHAPLTPVLPLLALIDNSCPTVGTFHAYHHFHPGYFIFRPCLRFFFHKLKAKIAVSPAAFNAVARYFPGDYRIIPNGVEVDRFRKAIPIEKFGNDKINILFVGRFDLRKGLIYLLRTFRHIRRRFPETRLIVVGNGILRFYYRGYVCLFRIKDVFFEGRASVKSLPRYYATADIFCSPATGKESFGIVLLEAMAAGKAVVASDIEGYRSVVTPDVGILFQPADVQSLFKAIKSLLENKSLRLRLGMNAQQKAQDFGWSFIVEKLLACYRGIVDSR